MNTLAPLESLYEAERGPDVPLLPELGALYGRLQFPAHPGRPHVIGNFVTPGSAATAGAGRTVMTWMSTRYESRSATSTVCGKTRR